jgi:hypothetical protein
VTVAFLLALPATASAATASVEPFVESPSVDPFGSCSRYMMCPPDMVVLTAAAGEANQLVVTVEPGTYPRNRFVLRDQSVPVQAGPGCAQIDPQTVACNAGALGPIQLGDADDWFASGVGGGDLFGGDGHDVLQRRFGPMAGGEGDDVLIGDQGAGGAGDDVLTVRSGSGDSGEDVLSCFPPGWCHLDGGAGYDTLTSGTGPDRLFGRSGNDVLRGGAGVDDLGGGPGDDRLVGGAGRDELDGDSGADLLVSRDDRSAGERTVRDRVDCGSGRRDRAVADRRDDVKRSCERVRLPPATGRAAAAAP